MTMRMDDDLELERMIDGELSFAEQRVLLGRLELLPDGWRQLALGLLEEQAFRREFSAAEPPAPCAAPQTVAAVPAVSQRKWRRRLSLVVAGLACLVVGMQVEHLRGQWSQVPVQKLAAIPGVPEPNAPASLVATEPDVLNAAADPGDAIAQPEDQSSPEFDAAAQQTMQVVLDDWPTPMEVAVLETTEDEAGLFLEQSAVSEELRRELELAGYLIYEDRKYVPVPLDDGREGIAPISDIIVEYVGTEDYQ